MKESLIDKYLREELENIVKASSTFKEVLQKLGYNTTSGSNNNTLKNKLEELKIDYSHFKTFAKPRVKRTEENIFIENSTASQKVLRS